MEDQYLTPHLTSSNALTLSHSNKLDDIRLTEHFKLSEFIKSPTATARHIDNTPTVAIINNLKLLCEHVLEPLRQHFNCPIIIGSGYRCKALNTAVGGVTNSQHMTGQAADIHIPDNATGLRWFTWMMSNLRFDQLIKEKATKTSKSFWIHVSLKASNNRQHVICNLIKNPNA